MTRAKNYFAWQSRLVVRELGQRVVEVGCGIGNFTGLLLDRELVVALDREEACVESLRERFPRRGNLHVLTCEVGSGAFRELARYRPDSVVCVNVLEHIEDDLGALRAMVEILAPGGPLDRPIPYEERHLEMMLVQFPAGWVGMVTVTPLHDPDPPVAGLTVMVGQVVELGAGLPPPPPPPPPLAPGPGPVPKAAALGMDSATKAVTATNPPSRAN